MRIQLGLVLVVLATVGCAPPNSSVGESSAAFTARKGVDYSYARPSPSALRSEGYTFAARYLSYDNSGTHGKILFAGEASALIAAGVDVAVVWEYGATDALGGYNSGVADAQTAEAQAKAAGMPAGRPIYFAVDFDATPADQTPINAYFDGVASVLGRNRTGAYAGYWVIKRAFDAGKISWGWQTYAWSGGNWDPRAQLRQTLNGITAGGDGNCCDLDESAADDFGQWGHASAWGAGYVSQSWPLASTAMTIVAGKSVAADIVLKNTGTNTWDGNTRLGTTQPRDRASAFADKSWLAPNRAAHVTGTVPPGGTFKFSFNFHAPLKPGNYHEFFSLVEEGQAWFGDPGQGGPADDQIEANIDVVAPAYSGEFVAQSFPASTAPAIKLGVGQSLDGWIDLKNVGAQPWKAGTTKLAPTPRDVPSPLADASWLSPTRVATLAADVAPGAVGRFPVKLTGAAPGDYEQTFALVEEGVTWFADAANGGGPADDFIRVHVVVSDTPQPAPGDGGAVADMSDGDGGTGTGAGGGGGSDGGAGPGGVGGNGATGGNTPKARGCSVAGSGGSAADVSPLVLILALALLLARRRQRNSSSTAASTRS